MKTLRHFSLMGTLVAAMVLPLTASAADQAKPREVEIVVEGGTYKPARVTVPEDVPVRLVFLKKDYSGCTKEVVFPTLNIKRELTPNKPVAIDLGPLKAGEVPFQCGMNMVKGAITVEPKK